MSNSFSAMKKSRSKEFDQLNNKLQKMATNKPAGDDRYWKLEVDKAGNGYAIIRFLPAINGEDMPFVRIWDHGFQGPGGWYIENSLTTLQQDDPVSEYNSKLWNSVTDDDAPERKQARKQKRRLNYTANIYVVKDSKNPENEGKVFLFKFGKRIFDKLNDAMNPPYEGEEAINPFDFWEGADFKLKARNKDGYRNYDDSEFDNPGKLSNPEGEELSDEQLEEIWNSQHALQEIVAPKNFKTYEELEARLYKVLALDGGKPAPTKTAEEDDDAGEMDFKPKFKEKPAKQQEESPSPSNSNDDDDDDDLSFFQGLDDDD